MQAGDPTMQVNDLICGLVDDENPSLPDHPSADGDAQWEGDTTCDGERCDEDRDGEVGSSSEDDNDNGDDFAMKDIELSLIDIQALLRKIVHPGARSVDRLDFECDLHRGPAPSKGIARRRVRRS